MLKKSFTLLAVTALISSTSFAMSPFQLMKDKVKSSLVSSQQQPQDLQSKFIGTWVGSCDYSDQSDYKLRIDNDHGDLVLTFLDDSSSETFLLNTIKSENNTSQNGFYDSQIYRLTKVNDNTLRFEGNIIIGNHASESPLVKIVGASVFTVNNNQLSVDTKASLFGFGNDQVMEYKCSYKRVQTANK